MKMSLKSKRKAAAASPAAAQAAPASPSPAVARRPSVHVPTQAYLVPKDVGLLRRTWTWYESSFAISMLEPWEKILLHSFAIALFSCIYLAATRYLPGQILRVAGRTNFYIYG